MIPKRGMGNLRLVIDFQALNKLFCLISFDVSNREQIMREIPEDARYLTVIYIQDAFFQFRIKDKSLSNF